MTQRVARTPVGRLTLLSETASVKTVLRLKGSAGRAIPNGSKTQE
jgi:hypothetical protein